MTLGPSGEELPDIREANRSPLILWSEFFFGGVLSCENTAWLGSAYLFLEPERVLVKLKIVIHVIFIRFDCDVFFAKQLLFSLSGLDSVNQVISYQTSLQHAKMWHLCVLCVWTYNGFYVRDWLITQKWHFSSLTNQTPPQMNKYVRAFVRRTISEPDKNKAVCHQCQPLQC